MTEKLELRLKGDYGCRRRRRHSVVQAVDNVLEEARTSL